MKRGGIISGRCLGQRLWEWPNLVEFLWNRYDFRKTFFLGVRRNGFGRLMGNVGGASDFIGYQTAVSASDRMKCVVYFQFWRAKQARDIRCAHFADVLQFNQINPTPDLRETLVVTLLVILVCSRPMPAYCVVVRQSFSVISHLSQSRALLISPFSSFCPISRFRGIYTAFWIRSNTSFLQHVSIKILPNPRPTIKTHNPKSSDFR